MSNFLDQLSYIVPAISISFLFIITSINIYFKIRRKFPATVNCWFCNENTKVPYADSNSWICPFCEQYNGFTKDGDYNCDIPSQRSSKLNKIKKNSSGFSLNGSITSTVPPTNGLCDPCNRNQELKMQQLASFEPENDAYFNDEVQDFRDMLEKAYRLCPRCERHLKRTLNNVKKNILGSKLAQLGATRLRAFDLHLNTSNIQKCVKQRRRLFTKIALFTLIVISILQLFKLSQSINITKSKLDTVFSESITATLLIVLSYLSAFKIIIVQFFIQLFSLPYISAMLEMCTLLISYAYVSINNSSIYELLYDIIQLPIDDESFNGDKNEDVITNVSACLLSIFVIFVSGLRTGTVLSLLMWSLNMALPTVMPNNLNTANVLFYDALKLLVIWSANFISLWNFVFLHPISKTETKTSNNSFHRIYSECNSDVSDDSEVESELNTSLQSNISVRSKKSVRSNKCNIGAGLVSNAPSVFSSTASTLYKPHSMYSLNNLSQTTNTNSFRYERCNDFSRASQMNLSNNIYDGNQSFYSSVSGSNAIDPFARKQLSPKFGAPSMAEPSYHGLNQFNMAKSDFDIRCSSRNSINEIPDDFESGITQLSISGLTEKRFRYKNQARTLMTPEPMTLLRNRNTLVMPSRLSFNESHQRAAAAHQSSWLAGGYWNNSTSPQKRQHLHASSQPNNHLYGQTKEVFPIISRCSSQSSGFESMKNGYENNNLRETSMHENGAMNCDSMFSNPSFLAQSTKIGNGLCVSTNNSVFGENLRKSYPQQTQNNFHHNLCSKAINMELKFPAMDKNHLLGEINSNASVKNVNKLNLFNTLSLNQNLPASATHYQSNEDKTALNNHFTTYSNNFVKFNKDNNTSFPKGNLLKLPEMNNTNETNRLNDLTKLNGTTQDTS